MGGRIQGLGPASPPLGGDLTTFYQVRTVDPSRTDILGPEHSLWLAPANWATRRGTLRQCSVPGPDLTSCPRTALEVGGGYVASALPAARYHFSESVIAMLPRALCMRAPSPQTQNPEVAAGLLLRGVGGWV